jgi:isoleucyl-tRNA synthetase
MLTAHYVLNEDSWFMRVTEKLKMRCLQELAHVKYVQSLNLRTTEDTHIEAGRLKAYRGHLSLQDFDSFYFNIVEEVNDFNEWCISEDSTWGIPIPFFTRKDTGDILIDSEIVSHVAEIVCTHGSDTCFTFPVKDLFPLWY